LALPPPCLVLVVLLVLVIENATGLEDGKENEDEEESCAKLHK
jgi:hypothetical protein